MVLQLQLAEEISATGSLDCTAISGVSSKLSCFYDDQSKTLTLTDAFDSEEQPENIQFKINGLTNPSETIITSSFKVSTFTSDDFDMDFLHEDLIVNFVCALPCKTCLERDNQACASCYSDGTTIFPFFYSNQCVKECPAGTFQSENYQCLACASELCTQCEGPSSNQCLSCSENASLVNGQCAKQLIAQYFFPFLIVSFVWIVIAFFVLLCWTSTQFIPSVLAVVSIIEWFLTWFQLSLYIFYDFKLLMLLTIVLGLILPYLINIALLVSYFGCFKMEKTIQSQLKNYRKSHTCLILVSVFVNDRVMKLAYSRFKNEPALVMEVLHADKKKRKILFIVNYISTLPSLGMIGCSVYSIIESYQMSSRLIMFVGIERLIISAFIVVLLMIEFSSCIQQHQGLIKRPQLEDTQKGKYFKAIDLSAMSGDQESEDQMRTNAMNKLLDSLKHMQTSQPDTKLEQMMGINGQLVQRRNSDPASYSQDHKKSKNYCHTTQNKDNDQSFITSNALLQDNQGEQSDEERTVMTVPLTPNRQKRFNQHQESSTAAEDQGKLFKIAKDSRIKVKDKKIQEEEEKNLKQMMDSIQKEKEELTKLNNELREQRIILEREKAEVERMRALGPQSARGTPSPKRDKLEEVNKKQTYTSRGKRENNGESKSSSSRSNSQKQKLNPKDPKKKNKTSRAKRTKKQLEAVRESRSELLDDLDKAKTRSKNSKKTVLVKRNKVSPSKLSVNKSIKKSIQSEKDYFKNHLLKTPRKCHGHSHHTLSAIRNLRNSQRQSSLVSSRINSLSPAKRKLDKGGSDSFRDYQQVRSPSHKKVTAKVYYSNKSESSVEDLMEETPSNYNILNGRLDGQSTGFRFGGRKDPSPLVLNPLKEELRQRKPLSKKVKIPKNSKKKKFRPQSDFSKYPEDALADKSFYNQFGDQPFDQETLKNSQLRHYNKSDFYNDSNYDRSSSRLTHNQAELIQDRQRRDKHILPQKKIVRKRFNLMGLDNTQAQYNPARIKALETAYLTKLAPTKSHSKLGAPNKTDAGLPKISFGPRQGSFTYEIYQKKHGSQKNIEMVKDLKS